MPKKRLTKNTLKKINKLLVWGDKSKIAQKLSKYGITPDDVSNTMKGVAYHPKVVKEALILAIANNKENSEARELLNEIA